YAYAHLPQRFKAQRQIHAADLPDAATRLRLLGLTVEKLTAAGYRYIGMDHFAREGDELARAQDAGTLQRNFQGYSTHGGCDLIGLGMSAISHIGASFSQNAHDLPNYYGAIDGGRLPVARGLAMSGDDVIRADAIGLLMCQGRLDIAAFEARHSLDFQVYFDASLRRLRKLARDDLVEMTPDYLQVTARGRYLLRHVAMCFDAYLAREATPAVRYSRAL
ncbi:MAG: coproporphyrinogen III oxidase, partial [Proteobacteria bacterium]|nr:coproporphyrinogen III oxidase [Pseudomonadota bacterium]